MLGFKIAITGVLVAAIVGAVISAIGKPMPHPAIALPLMATFAAGVVTAVGGILAAIWL